MKSKAAIFNPSGQVKFRRSIGFAGIIFIFLILFGFDADQNPGGNLIKKIIFINPYKSSVISEKENNDVHSLKYSLFVAGINFSETSIDKLDSIRLNDFDIIILPYAAAKDINNRGISMIKNAVNSGSSILFDGVSKINEALHIAVQKKSVPVTRIRDLQFPREVLYWTGPVDVQPIDTTQNNFHQLCIDDTTKLPIAVSGTYGKGKFIFLSPLFDPVTEKGYTRFPFLTETLSNIFDVKVLAERKSVEMFFDPGMRDGSISIKDLVKLWRKRDIKRIFAAGWYFDYGYDYETLINSCHANGILVYCWLETPMISKGFWDKHPEWREKTAYLKDAYIDWRYLMNLANDDCRKEVFNIEDKLLMSYDWDGVNLAELYFEPSPVGPELPENFTPMNDLVRTEFKSASGFDPVSLFDTHSPHYWKTNRDDWKAFATYRKNLCYRLKQQFLDFLTTLEKRKNDFEVMLTVIDVSMTPELSDNIGEDTQNALSLYNNYNITMQIEDPSNCWGLTPERYNKLGLSYRKYIKDKNRLVFDCNVVNAHEQGYGGFPAEDQPFMLRTRLMRMILKILVLYWPTMPRLFSYLPGNGKYRLLILFLSI